ncbi:MAG: WYL domain-containing protein [Nocardioidaceae bacterium]|nr:WYL domain-containing protein [Nocardioidaceae bacterium]
MNTQPGTRAAQAGVQAGATAQVARLLTLVPFLHQRDGVRLDEAARLLEISPAQVLRDLKVLFMCGLPGGLPDDLIDVDLDAIESAEGSPLTEGVIRVENADYLARPLRLTAVEATALIVALRMLQESSTGETPALVTRVLDKLESAASGPGAARIAVRPSPRDVEQAVVARRARMLNEAILEGRQVQLTYHVASRAELSEPVVDPYGVVRRGVFSYLDGWCHRAAADRLFRLDRIVDAVVLDTPIVTARRAPRDLARGLFTDIDGPDQTVVTLRLAPQARWVVDYYPVRAVRDGADGSTEVDLVVADRRWLHRLVLRLAPHARVVAPAEIVDSFLLSAQETLSLYR